MSELLIFDGGTGREIERQGGPFRQPEWSALALYEDPDVVRKVHESYIDAGAQAITTNSYAVVPFHIGQERYEKDAKCLLELAVDLAVAARGDRKDIDILGTIPPLCGSYEPERLDKTKADLILDDFLAAYKYRVDGLLVETIGSIEEAVFYLTKIVNSDDLKDLPIWLSFCMKTNYGENQPRLLTDDLLKDAVRELKKAKLMEKVSVVLVNCCDVRIVLDSIKELRELVKCRIGAYPNAFSIPPPDAANHTLRQVDFNITPQALKTAAKLWVTAGASVLGGCCGVGPEHIRAMASIKEDMSP